MKKKKERQAKHCPLCGERFSERNLYAHLLDQHDNDKEALAWHVAKLTYEKLNR